MSTQQVNNKCAECSNKLPKITEYTDCGKIGCVQCMRFQLCDSCIDMEGY